MGFMEDYLISCRDSSLGYDGSALIQHFDFKVRSGEYVCVVGENGSGKSTLLKTVLGLMKPVAGRVELGKNIRSGAVGYLPQQTQAQRNFPASVMEVVMSGFLNGGDRLPFYSRIQKERALENMKKLGIEGLRRDCYGHLSGGQQQRVLLARALCAAKDILVLDEPVTGLDPMASAILYESLRRLHKEGMAIVMVTHDLKMAVKEADMILHLNDGSYFYGSTSEYRHSELAKMFR